MPNYRRYYLPNALTFITCVTHQRARYLDDRQNLDIFWHTLREVQKLHPFHLFAYVILPDHFHWIMQTPEAQPNFGSTVFDVKLRSK